MLTRRQKIIFIILFSMIFIVLQLIRINNYASEETQESITQKMNRIEAERNEIIQKMNKNEEINDHKVNEGIIENPPPIKENDPQKNESTKKVEINQENDKKNDTELQHIPSIDNTPTPHIDTNTSRTEIYNFLKTQLDFYRQNGGISKQIIDQMDNMNQRTRMHLRIIKYKIINQVVHVESKGDNHWRIDHIRNLLQDLIKMYPNKIKNTILFISCLDELYDTSQDEKKKDHRFTNLCYV
eukprot:TRINITY_DN16772_c0_g1_i1.p1 TRINITY_DN16772_c0_g1~~TRINITY_DN16772_c0_g1_i1.p1  ORF type:complete len:241 (+),score=46.37 TRINITY_DN16772_c0_g1_i1:18-740(+)